MFLNEGIDFKEILVLQCSLYRIFKTLLSFLSNETVKTGKLTMTKEERNKIIKEA